MAFADAARALLLVLPFLYASLEVLLIVSALFGFLSALSQVTLERVVVASGQPMARTQMTLEAMNNIAFILGSAMAAGLVAYIALHTMFIVLVVFFVLPIAFTWGIGEAGRASVFSFKSDVAIAFTILASQPRLRQIVMTGFMFAVTVGVVMSTGPAMVIHVFDQGNEAFAYVQMYAALATLVAILFNRFIPGLSSYIQWVGVSCLGLGLLLLITTPLFLMWILGYSLFFAGIALFSIHLRCERILYIPAEHYGKALGVIMLLTAMGMPFGGLCVGYFADWISTRQVLGIACFIFAIGVLIFIWPTRHRVLQRQ